MTKKKQLTRLDRLLLKGFYTNSRIALENPHLISKDLQKKETMQVNFYDDPD